MHVLVQEKGGRQKTLRLTTNTQKKIGVSGVKAKTKAGGRLSIIMHP